MRNPSIAVVVLDTLRKDIFSRYFEWLPGTSFENAYSTSHWTVPAHASLLTGRYASEVGIHSKSTSFDYPESSIAEILQNSGYFTRMWTVNVMTQARGKWDRGFSQFLGTGEIHPDADISADWSKFDETNTQRNPLKYTAAVKYAIMASSATFPSLRHGLRLSRSSTADGGAQSVLRRLERTQFGDDEFLLINLMSVHTPHRPPRPFRTVDEEVGFSIGDAFAGLIDDPDRCRRAYDDSAVYLSTIYKKILAELLNDFDYVITTSDHGELLGEHGMWNHGYGIYPELVRIPLVITGDEADNRLHEDVVSLLDVPRTVAELTGVEFESRGRDLLDNSEPTDRLVEFHGFLPWHEDQLARKGVPEAYDKYDRPLYGMVTKSNRYIYQTHENGIVSPAGPVEKSEEQRLETVVSDIPKRSIEQIDTSVSPQVRKQLQELGYA